MSTIKLLVLAGIWFLSTSIAVAQFSVDGQFRTRFEYRDGYKMLASENTYGFPLVFQRSRLIIGHKEDNLTVKISGQDARIWGQNSTGMASNTTHIYEAWAKYNFTPMLSVKLGRQELRYDDQRVITFNDFSLTGLTYDALLFTYDNPESKASLHWSTMINNAGQSNFLGYYSEPLPKYISFVWASRPLGDKVVVNAVNFFDATQRNDRHNVVYGRNTIGANAIISPTELFGLRFGGYYQFGKTWHNWGGGIQQKLKVSAYSFNSTLWVKPVDVITASLNIDVYSGQDWSSASPTFRSFYRLLSAGHALLGYMDYFLSKNLTEVDYAGLIDFFLRVDYSISERAKLQAVVHNFMMEKPYFRTVEPNGFEKVEPILGQEVDLVFNYKVTKAFSLEGAWMVMLPTATLERLNGLSLGGSTFSHYGYISLLFSPSLFSYTKPPKVDN